MARSIATIQTLITTQYVSQMASVGYTVDPTTWSAVSIERCFIYIIAFCQNILEQLFDQHTLDVNTLIATDKTHTAQWYATMAKSFQFGYTVIQDQDYYDNTLLTDAQVAASQIIAYAAVTEENEGLNLKVAKDTGDLVPLTNTEVTAFTAYMKQIKDAGVFLSIISTSADSLKLNAGIVYNPQVLDSNGVSISDGSTPVVDAINAYLKNLPFNGVFAPQDLTDAVQKVDGVIYFTPSYIGVSSDGGATYNPIAVKYIPASGYVRFVNPTDLVLTYTTN